MRGCQARDETCVANTAKVNRLTSSLEYRWAGNLLYEGNPIGRWGTFVGGFWKHLVRHSDTFCSVSFPLPGATGAERAASEKMLCVLDVHCTVLLMIRRVTCFCVSYILS